MKRSEIDGAILWALGLIEEQRFFLPPFGYRSAREWQETAGDDSVKRLMLGWDVTDFGIGDFKKTGAVLFTLRNGTPCGQGTPYAEKLLMFSQGQSIPFHYHIEKTEDIINRAGGVLCVTLFNADTTKAPDGDRYAADAKNPVFVSTDGRKRAVPAGGTIELAPGESITLRPYVYHRLGAKEGRGDLLAGEVSSVNDDLTDNVFLMPLPRFSTIEEDADRRFVLCNEYASL